MKCSPEGSGRSRDGAGLTCGRTVGDGAEAGALSAGTGAVGAVLGGTVSALSRPGASAAGACGVGTPCSASACTRPANGAGRSAASQTMAGDSFKKVKLCDQPASLVTVAFQIALPSGVAKAIP